MRTITKLQTLLVLFLTTAMIGFAGCKDDDGDVPGPTPGNEATYAISGKVTDVDGAAMADVNVALSGAKSMSAKTAADGQYTFDLGKNAAGAYKVTFSKEGYIERSYDITVKKVESGLGENIQNAVMEKGTTPEPTPEYKKAKYFLTVSVKDEAGKDITASDLSVLVKLSCLTWQRVRMILPLRLPVMRRQSLKLLFLRLRTKRRLRVTVIHLT